MNQVVTFLLAFACVLSYSGVVRAECCQTSLKLYYTIEDGYCADVGGHHRRYGYGCEITICADGTVLNYLYCGIGKCNIFGCNCNNGCRSGYWKDSFLDKNSDKNITVTDEYWI